MIVSIFYLCFCKNILCRNEINNNNNKNNLVLALNAIDNSGETHFQVDHIIKRKLNLDGQPISNDEKNGKIFINYILN